MKVTGDSPSLCPPYRLDDQSALFTPRNDRVYSHYVCKGVPARINASLATLPARSIIRAKPAVVNGAPRSDVNTKGDFGS
jgi:hypothetical protein